MMGRGRSFLGVRSLEASRTPALLVEGTRMTILDFSFGSVLTDLNKRGAEEATTAPNRRGVAATEDKEVDAP